MWKSAPEPIILTEIRQTLTAKGFNIFRVPILMYATYDVF